MSAAPWAVIADAANVLSFAILRSLGRHGVSVAGLFSRATGFRPYARAVRASRYLRLSREYDAEGREEGMVAALVRLAEALPARPVLFPVSDRDMIAVSRHRAVLEPYFRLGMPPHATLEMLLEKERFARFAAENELPVPRTVVVESHADAVACAATMRFPCVVKPPWRDRPWFAAYGNRKLLRATSSEELLRQVAEALRCSPRLVVQESLEGPEREIVCSFAYLDEASRPLALSVCRKLRQYPARFGNTALAESIEDDEIAALTRAIAQRLGAIGYLSIEAKWDPSDGRYKILEITPARLNRQAGIADASGTNIALTWYDHLAGRTSAPRPAFSPAAGPARSYGVRWASEVNDLRALPAYLRDGTWSLATWLASYRGVRRFELLARDDLGPAFALLGAGLAAVGQRLVRRILAGHSAKH